MSRYEITDEQRAEILRTGNFKLTPEQRELSFADSFVRMAFDYGLQYLGAARFALASAFCEIGPTLLHHAVETFLQGCLAVQDTPAQIRNYRETYFSHKLPRLWQALTPRYPAAGLDEFTAAVDGLERFREVRFPESLAAFGGCIQVGFFDPGPNAGSTSHPERNFSFGTEQIDRLVAKLFEVAGFSPSAFDWRLRNVHAAPYFAMHSSAPLVRDEPAPRVPAETSEG